MCGRGQPHPQPTVAKCSGRTSSIRSTVPLACTSSPSAGSCDCRQESDGRREWQRDCSSSISDGVICSAPRRAA